MTSIPDALVTGSPASRGAATGAVSIITATDAHHAMDALGKGGILVTEMTTPDFVPLMKRAGAIVTDKGGRTCHAAIVSRELGIPCIVGTGNATHLLKNGQVVTVDATAGKVYEGEIEIADEISGVVTRYAKTKTSVYVNLADPERAEEVAKLGSDGVGLLRAEFIIAHLGNHPRYMIDQRRGEEFTNTLAEKIKIFARAFNPRPVTYRLTDFKTNEYRDLMGGEQYEPVEENPMLGFRGAYRYAIDKDVFNLEVEALKNVEKEFDNVRVMVPFVHTPQELKKVKEMLEAKGIAKGRFWMMAELPSNVILLDQFLDVGVDGVSIGSNDLTQLVLGLDRDNEKLADVFDERNDAVMWCLERIITICKKRGVPVGICGQAPSVHADLTEKLVEWGITSVSVSPDAIVQTRNLVGDVEKKLAS